MQAFIDGMCYVALLNWSEFERLQKRQDVESELALKGGIPTGKILRITFNPGAKEIISKGSNPDGSDWGNLKVVTLTINQKGMDVIQLDARGLYTGDLETDFLIQCNGVA